MEMDDNALQLYIQRCVNDLHVYNDVSHITYFVTIETMPGESSSSLL